MKVTENYQSNITLKRLDQIQRHRRWSMSVKWKIHLAIKLARTYQNIAIKTSDTS